MHRGPGHTFFREGEETDFALLIKKGHIKIVVRSRRTGTTPRTDVPERSRTVAIRKPGEIVGELVAADERIDEATKKLADSDLAVEQKVAKTLLWMSEERVGKQMAAGFALPLSQPDVAAMVGSSLDSVKKVLRTFKDAEIVGTGRRVLYVVDVEALTRIAHGNRTASR